MIGLCLCTALLFSGCGTEQHTGSKSISENQNSSPFPEEIHRNLTDKISVNARCIYPPECKGGTAQTALLGDSLLWDRKEEIRDLLFQGKETEEELTNDYDSLSEAVYLTDNGSTFLSISSDNYLHYVTKSAVYIENVIYPDEQFDDYNGDKYLKETDLPFMSQDMAWSKVQEFLASLGAEVSNPVCYVMNHTVMETEEDRLAEEMQDSDGKEPTKKDTSWTEDDDCYYFAARTSWKGYSVLPMMSGEGISDENVTIIYNKDGIQELTIGECYTLKEGKEITIQNPESVIEKAREFLENLISEDSYEIQQLSLCQKVTGFDSQKHKARILPVWECKLLVKNAELEGDSYYQKLYFDAQTLKNVE